MPDPPLARGRYFPGETAHIKPYFSLGEHRGPTTAVADLTKIIWKGCTTLVASGGSDATSEQHLLDLCLVAINSQSRTPESNVPFRQSVSSQPR